ncbi:hypothetical protein HDV00_011107 [Rhizophlyctis rosea]|nr:hypothetical protein HDV00_011107 [Rhizophlyctis rosea]
MDSSILLSKDDVGRAKKLAAHVSAEEKLREEMLKEKEQLHRQSLERTKDWGTTILGQRRRRLAAREEKARKTEEEQQRIDAEWAKVRAAERQAAVDRARQMQFMEQSPVRELHAGALLANVIEERDKQLAYKRQLTEKYANAPEIEENFKLVSKERDEKDLQDAKQSWMERRVVAAQQRRQVEGREEAERQRRQFDDDYQTLKNTQAVTELRAETEKMEQKKQKEGHQLQEFIEMQQMWKNERKKLQEEEEQRGRLENEKYREMKLIITKKRKEVEQGRINVRRNMGQLVADTTQGGDLERLRKIEDHIEFGIRQHAEDSAKREAADRARRKKMEDEIEKFKVEHERETRQRHQKEQDEDRAMREHLEAQAREFFSKIESDRQRAAKAQDELKQNHKQQIELNQKSRALSRLESLSSERTALHSHDVDNDALEKYAAELMKEWNDTGRDTKPIIRALRKIKQSAGGVVPEGTNPVDTFERLGFTVRWFDRDADP